jgi:hypothetical protein
VTQAPSGLHTCKPSELTRDPTTRAVCTRYISGERDFCRFRIQHAVPGVLEQPVDSDVDLERTRNSVRPLTRGLPCLGATNSCVLLTWFDLATANTCREDEFPEDSLEGLFIQPNGKRPVNSCNGSTVDFLPVYGPQSGAWPESLTTVRFGFDSPRFKLQLFLPSA